MKINLTESITAMQTRALKAREGTKLTGKGTIRKLLEEMADPDKPLIIAIYGTKKDRLPGDYFMCECRSLLVYEGAAFKEQEKIRREKEEEERKQAARTARLDQIKAKIRTELKAESVEREKEGADFDRKYDEQKESAIEKEAAAILAKEEGADKC